jgi:hypothetical protein
MHKVGYVLLLLLLLTGCSEEPFYVAKLGNAGSTTGQHGIRVMYLSDVLGGGGFAYGAVSSYPGASADIGRMGVPNHIEGCWANHVEERSKFYKISVPIDSDLAEKKIRTMQNYYKNYSTIWPVMQVIVDSVYSLACFNRTDDCTPKKNADPNHWVQRAPNGLTDVVVLFDGKGEYVDCNSKLN